MEDELIRPEPSLFARLAESGPLGMAALAAVLLAVILVAASPYLVSNRRHLYILCGLAFVLGVGGYLVYDWQHIGLNLSMRDAEGVREDCRQLMQRQKSATGDQAREISLTGAQLPESFARLGAKAAYVAPDSVHICLYTNGFGGAWGFLYAPERRSSTEGGRLSKIRPTWYRDLYEFRQSGE